MSAANAVLGFPRWTGDFAFSGGGFLAAYPLANLQLEPLTKVARSVDLALGSTQWVATSTQGRLVRLIAFVRHNASLTGRFRVRLYSDTALTQPLHDSGWLEFWPPVYVFGTLDFGDPSFFTLTYSDADIADQAWTRPLWLDQGHIVRGLAVEIDDAANPAGYFECGLFEIAQGWQVSANFWLGAQYGFKDRSQALEALGGVEHVERRDKPRLFSGEIGYLARDEALARGFELQRRHDRDVPVLWFPQPADPTHWLRNCFLAKHAELGLMAYAARGPRGGYDRLPLALKEVLG